MELLFLQRDDTPLPIDAADIEIVSPVHEDGLVRFGPGSRFRHHGREYKITDLDVHCHWPDPEGTVGGKPASNGQVRVVYRV